jgi:hypothetical protein
MADSALTLNRWRAFQNTPKTIVFPHLELIGRDHEPPLVIGSGEVRMESQDIFSFNLRGTPADIRYALAAAARHREAPYDGLARPRLVGTDEEGVAWLGGYTTPLIDHHKQPWTFTGEIDGLCTHDQSATVSHGAGTELLFPLRIGDPMTIAMARFARTVHPGSTGRIVREYELKALGTTIRFAFDADRSALLVTAACSSELPVCHAENWLGEPLRIIFGQLLFPRLVARNLGNGRATVWVRRSPALIRTAGWASLLGSDSLIRDDEDFWSLYRQLLELVARARDNHGKPNFEQHKVTRLYEEVIQASRGSRWVWALTFASAIEAIVRMMSTKPAQLAQTEVEAIESLAGYIGAGPGEAHLKEKAINGIRSRRDMRTVETMRGLVAKGTISEEQRLAWEAIRNRVMHGELLSPNSNETEDKRLMTLAAMMHALTRELLGRSV